MLVFSTQLYSPLYSMVQHYPSPSPLLCVNKSMYICTVCEGGGGIGVVLERVYHGRMNYKDTKPYMSAFLSVDLLTDFAAFCLADFIDWRYIHSRFVFSTQLVNYCPQGTCVLLPLYCTFSLTSFPLPTFPMYSIHRQSVTVWGGGGGVEMYCGPYSAEVLHSF
jgi:hypothetical protein